MATQYFMKGTGVAFILPPFKVIEFIKKIDLNRPRSSPNVTKKVEKTLKIQ